MERKPNSQNKANWIHQLLDQWEYTSEDPASLEKKEAEAVDIDSRELGRDWALVRSKTIDKDHTPVIRKRSSWLRYAAVLVPLLAGLVLTLFFVRQNNSGKDGIGSKSGLENVDLSGDLGAGGQKEPFVILEDGTKVSLTEANKQVEDLLGSNRTLDGNELSYTTGAAERTTTEARYNTVVIPKGMEYKLKLSDGTQVWLNANTVLRYMVDFSGQAVRRVYLEKGEAYFQVAKDAAHPFVVSKGELAVQVLGTEFNMNTYAHKIQTTLLEGKVEIQVGSKKTTLNPNEQVNYSEGGSDLQKARVEGARFASWRNGVFDFEEDKLEFILEILANHYDISVRFKDSSLKGLHFNGVFDKKDRLEDILKRIERTTDIKFTKQGKEVIVGKSGN